MKIELRFKKPGFCEKPGFWRGRRVGDRFSDPLTSRGFLVL